MRLREKGQTVPVDPSSLASLYIANPFLLGRDGRRGPLPWIENLYCPYRSHLNFQERFWHYKMEGSYGRNIWSKLKLFAGAFILLNAWILYKRVSFYMEHSFDLVKPDIDYLVHRF